MRALYEKQDVDSCLTCKKKQCDNCKESVNKAKKKYRKKNKSNISPNNKPVKSNLNLDTTFIKDDR